MAYELESFESGTDRPLLRTRERHRDIGHRLPRLAPLHWAIAGLRRLLAARQAENIAELPPYLLKDIGLAQDFRPQGGLAHPAPPV
jgi:hypothetical protein